MNELEVDRIEVNGRSYKRPHSVAIVGICIDGCDPAYLDAAREVMPELAAITASGCHGQAHSVVPSYTNPNNVAIVTGTTADVNGIPGNYYFDEQSGREVLMNDPAFLRCPTLLSTFSAAGLDVAAITTKDKLRKFLAEGWRGICFSVEEAENATLEENRIEGVCEMVGRASPGIYDPEASVFCIEAGVRLLEHYPIDCLYLSTTDFVQHKYAPGSPEANHYYARLDQYLGALNRSGAIIGITADHGMNAKVNEDDSPKVQYIEQILVTEGVSEARVILPITDPYVVHHGALGSYATVYLDAVNVETAAAILVAVPGVELVLTRAQAAQKYSLPADRIGDLVVLADRNTTLGRTPDWHDLSAVESGLRSHGGLHEAIVPFITNRPLTTLYQERLNSDRMRNFDLFDVLCNGIQG
jgi:phosphonoacetate hydrolase